MIRFFSYFAGFIFIISFLFVSITFLGAIIKSKFSAQKLNGLLAKFDGIRGNIIAAVVGMLTPFCSCTTVPIFAGLIETNVNFGVAMSFLIASPAINLAAIILLLTLFGLKIAVIYIGAIFIIAVFGGYILGKIKLRDQIKPTFISLADSCRIGSFKEAFYFSLKSLRYFILILALSAVIGALIYNYIPGELLLKLTLENSIWAVPIAVLVGAVVYADIILLIPTGYAFLAKGVNQGIVLAFMMSAAGISISEILLLSKIIKIKPLVYFITIIVSLYTIIGIIFYYL